MRGEFVGDARIESKAGDVEEQTAIELTAVDERVRPSTAHAKAAAGSSGMPSSLRQAVAGATRE